VRDPGPIYSGIEGRKPKTTGPTARNNPERNCSMAGARALRAMVLGGVCHLYAASRKQQIGSGRLEDRLGSRQDLEF
jgi:hypothetical protein